MLKYIFKLIKLIRTFIQLIKINYFLYKKYENAKKQN